MSKINLMWTRPLMTALTTLFVALTFIAPEAALAAGKTIGKFMVVKGKVFVQRDGKKKKVRLGFKLKEKDQVIAEKLSRAKIVMLDKNIIHVSPETQMSFAEYVFNPKANKKKVLLDVIYGKVRSNVQQKYDGDKNKFQVRTKSAVAGVRGTDFLTGYNKQTQQSSVVTFEGSVAIGQPGAGGTIKNPVINKPGQMATINSGGQVAQQKLPASQLQAYNSETDTDTTSDSSDSDRGVASENQESEDTEESESTEDQSNDQGDSDSESEKEDKGDKQEKQEQDSEQSAENEKQEKQESERSSEGNSESEGVAENEGSDSKGGDAEAGPEGGEAEGRSEQADNSGDGGEKQAAGPGEGGQEGPGGEGASGGDRGPASEGPGDIVGDTVGGNLDDPSGGPQGPQIEVDTELDIGPVDVDDLIANDDSFAEFEDNNKGNYDQDIIDQHEQTTDAVEAIEESEDPLEDCPACQVIQSTTVNIVIQ